MKKIVLVLLAALALFSCDLQGTKPKGNEDNNQEVIKPFKGVVAEYLLDNSALDSSGNRNNGTLNGPVATVNRFGQADSAYLFDGQNDYIEVKNSPTLHSDRGVTISGWFNVKEFSPAKEWQVLFWKGEPELLEGAVQREYGLWINKAGFFHFNSTPAGGASQVSFNTAPGMIKAGDWVHFACIVDSDKGEMLIYMNGKPLADTHTADSYGNANIKTTGGPLILGNSGLADAALNSGHFNGTIDDIRIHNYALSAAEVQALYAPDATNIVTLDQTIPQEGLVAQYLLGSDAFDSSSNSLNGILNGAVKTADRAGEPGKAYLFDGHNDGIRVENSPLLNSDSSLSISGWVNIKELATTPLNYRNIFWKGDTEGINYDTYQHRAYTLWYNHLGQFQFSSTPAGAPTQKDCMTGENSVKLGSWQHFVAIIDKERGEMRLYIDGILRTTNNTYGNKSAKASTSSLYFGTSIPGNSINRLNGGLDDIRIYNRVLTDSEIQTLYTAN